MVDEHVAEAMCAGGTRLSVHRSRNLQKNDIHNRSAVTYPISWEGSVQVNKHPVLYAEVRESYSGAIRRAQGRPARQIGIGTVKFNLLQRRDFPTAVS